MRRTATRIKTLHRRYKSTVIFGLCAGLLSAVSMPAAAHPDPSNTERVEMMTEKHNEMRARAEERRAKAKERTAKRRAEANERREKHKQDEALRRAETKKERETYLAFKTELLGLLKQDGVITSETEPVRIVYVDGHPVANDIDLTEQFGDTYATLWANHGRLITESSYMNILPRSFELREVQKGTSRHFMMQTD